MHVPASSGQDHLANSLSRTLTALTLIQSALVHGGLMNFYHVLFLPSLIFKWRPEIWRLATPFLLTGPGLSFVFDLYFSMMPRYLSMMPRVLMYQQCGTMAVLWKQARLVSTDLESSSSTCCL
jgi:hypothetical protein